MVRLMENKSIGIIILAAGEAKRFDYFPKQLLKFNDKTLIQNAVESALNSETDLVCVVLGANAEKINAEIENLSIEIVINENWQSGMASSLQKGLQKLLEINPNLSAVLVQLCDQPLITTQILNQLINSFKNSKSLIVASEYEETIGVPAIFEKSLFDELLKLKSSEGAKKVILKHLDSVKKISIPEAALDIDTNKDFTDFLDTKKLNLFRQH